MISSVVVSVVIPTYNRPALLQRCLTALRAQDFDPTAYEIIVVDDAACATTRQLVDDLANSAKCTGQNQPAKPALRYLPMSEKHGPAAARNSGWRAARGTIVAFTDDDCVPAPDWLQSGSAAFVNGVVGVSGQVVVPLPDRPTDYEQNHAGLGRSEFVTANCFYRRDALATVGGFDERFTMAWREDSDLFFTLLERRSHLVHAPEAVVVHPVRPAVWGISLMQQQKSMFNALLYKKHPQLYRRHLPPVTPWHYYAIVTALATALGGLIVGRRRPALGACAVWLLLTGRFCRRRLRETAHTPRHIAEMIVTSLLIPPLAIFWRIRGALKFRVVFW